MPCCVAFGCSTKEFDKKAVPPITFHCFPADEAEKAKWIQAVRRENWKPSRNSRLCSKHFKEADFDRSPFYTMLKKGIVPSVFNAFPDHLKQKATQMVRKYKRKTDKGKWTAEDLRKSKQAVAEGLSLRKAAEKFKIPFSTLHMRLKSGTDSNPSLGRKCAFPPAHEKVLADHVKTLSKIFYGITATKLRKIAFDYAEKNNLNHRFNKETKMAGLDWMYGFIARNKISVRKSEDWDASEYQVGMDADNITCCNQENEIYETSTNTGIVIKIEPGLSDIIHQGNLSQDDTEDYIGSNRLRKIDPQLRDSMVGVDSAAFCKKEDENRINSNNTSIDIKIEPGLTDYISQDDTTKDSIPGCSQLKEEHSSTLRFHSSVDRFSDAEKTSKTGVEMMENCQSKMRDQQQQTNEMPIAERWMIKWNGDQPIAEPVLNEVHSKRPMTAAERKRKSREKKRAEAKFFHHKPENCSCRTNLKIRDKLKAEVDALTHRKQLLSAQIALLQAQPQQVKLGLTENDSEDDLSNVSTNDSSTESSRLNEVSFETQTKMKKAISVDKDDEIDNDSILKKTFFGLNGMLDDFQVFGEFVATELRNLKSDVNRRKLKRMIQKVIIEVSESEDC